GYLGAAAMGGPRDFIGTPYTFDFLIYHLPSLSLDDGGCSAKSVFAFGRIQRPQLISARVFPYSSSNDNCLLVALSVAWYRRAKYRKENQAKGEEIPNLTYKRKAGRPSSNPTDI